MGWREVEKLNRATRGGESALRSQFHEPVELRYISEEKSKSAISALRVYVSLSLHSPKLPEGCRSCCGRYSASSVGIVERDDDTWPEQNCSRERGNS